MRNVTSLLIVLSLWLLLVLGCISPSTSTNSTTPPKKSVLIDKSAEKQKARQKLIQEMINRRLVAQIKFPGTTPELWVAPGFYALDFDTKQQLVSVVYAYYCNGDDRDMVLVYDNLTGKQIGTYSTLSGGLSLD